MKASAVANRLLFICPTCSPIGGLQTWLDELCTGLEARGWEPIVALVHGPTTNDSAAYRRAHPALKHTVVIDGTAMPMAARVRAVMREIARLNPEFVIPLTVIDAHDAVCALKMNGEFAGCYVLTLHGNLPQQVADASLFQGFADVSVNPGALTCRLVESVGMPAERIVHVPNGTQVHAPREVGDDPTRPIRLAYVGRLSQADKRVLDLVPMVEGLRKRGVEFELDVVGDGPCGDELRASLESDQVRFHGFVDADRLHAELFPSWDVVLLFSQSEAFGISLVEAMSHGVVPVSSRFVGHRSEGFLVEGETAMLFDIGDAEACAAQVERLADDRELLRRLSLAGHALVSERYAWEACVDGWERALVTARDAAARPVPLEAPRPLAEGGGLAARFPALPKSWVDACYRWKHRLLGVPEVMKTGEEWPLHTRCFEADELAAFESRSVALDSEAATEDSRALNPAGTSV